MALFAEAEAGRIPHSLQFDAPPAGFISPRRQCALTQESQDLYRHRRTSRTFDTTLTLDWPTQPLRVNVSPTRQRQGDDDRSNQQRRRSSPSPRGTSPLPLPHMPSDDRCTSSRDRRHSSPTFRSTLTLGQMGPSLDTAVVDAAAVTRKWSTSMDACNAAVGRRLSLRSQSPRAASPRAAVPRAASPRAASPKAAAPKRAPSPPYEWLECRSADDSEVPITPGFASKRRSAPMPGGKETHLDPAMGLMLPTQPFKGIRTFAEINNLDKALGLQRVPLAGKKRFPAALPFEEVVSLESPKSSTPAGSSVGDRAFPAEAPMGLAPCRYVSPRLRGDCSSSVCSAWPLTPKRSSSPQQSSLGVRLALQGYADIPAAAEQHSTTHSADRRFAAELPGSSCWVDPATDTLKTVRSESRSSVEPARMLNGDTRYRRACHSTGAASTTSVLTPTRTCDQQDISEVHDLLQWPLKPKTHSDCGSWSVATPSGTEGMMSPRRAEQHAAGLSRRSPVPIRLGEGEFGPRARSCVTLSSYDCVSLPPSERDHRQSSDVLNSERHLEQPFSPRSALLHQLSPREDLPATRVPCRGPGRMPSPVGSQSKPPAPESAAQQPPEADRRPLSPSPNSLAKSARRSTCSSNSTVSSLPRYMTPRGGRHSHKPGSGATGGSTGCSGVGAVAGGRVSDRQRLCKVGSTPGYFSGNARMS